MCCKQRFGTASDAERHRKRIVFRKGRFKDRGLNVYFCRECSNSGPAVYHIGHRA